MKTYATSHFNILQNNYFSVKIYILFTFIGHLYLRIYSFVHSFIVSNCCILVMFVIIPKLITRNPGISWKLHPVWDSSMSSASQSTTNTHIHTLIHIYSQFSVASQPADMFLENGKTLKKTQKKSTLDQCNATC